ncbi:MAG: glucose-6-phosphate dehydrogenase [Bryobacterales bacterium]|nr:glucose-6-phosphate dehydrogenase [Bryobacterales bacterium]
MAAGTQLTNPFEDPLRYERRVPEATVVIFGANGDLTRRKLMPALYRLALERRLSAGFAVLGISRTPMTDEQFREKMRQSVERFLENSPFDAQVWDGFAKGLFYLPGDVHDPAAYQRLSQRLEAIEQARNMAGNVLFYLSTQPSQYATVAQGLSQAGLANGRGWRRLVVEKPFGHDGASARELDRSLHAVFAEPEIYRIDHYLGKETVQNILAFRFGNGIFEPLWNRRYVNHVQITAAESIGVEGRGAFYQETGALRDMIQNHLLQVLATVGMEPSATYDAQAVRDERAKLLRCIRILKPEEVEQDAVAGQYGPARIGGTEVPGFRQEPGVDPASRTDTYAAATFFIENWRWAGVPFYIRTGKRLPKRVTEIAIRFQPAPHVPFEGQAPEAPPDLLVLRIQPDEGISLKFASKQPGPGMRLRPVSMDFNYGTSFGERTPSAYETLLLDAIQGDATLYTRQDMVEASWRVVQPILEVWENRKFDFPNYPAGAWGPEAADRMLARRGHEWRRP